MATKAVVLHQNFQSPWTFLLNTDHPAGCRCHDGRTSRCRQIDTVMVGAGMGMVRKHTRTERRGDARGSDGRHKHRFGLWLGIGCGYCQDQAEHRSGDA